MNNKQQLLLLLISTDPKYWNLYRLVKIFDSADFPSDISNNLQPLLEQKLLKVNGWFENGTPGAYIATEKGKAFVSENIDIGSIKNYVSTMDSPALLLLFLDTHLF